MKKFRINLILIVAAALLLCSFQVHENTLTPKATLSIEENRGIFVGDGPHIIEVSITADVDKSVEVELALNTDFGKPIETYTKTIDIRQGRADVRFELNQSPGFYFVVFSLVEDGIKTELARSNIGMNPERIESPQDKQPDFETFWENTLAELAKVTPEYRLTPLDEHSNDIRRAYRVDMKSFGGEDICGILTEPVAPGKYPVMIYYMGYGSDLKYPDPSANPQMIEFTLCVRNQSLNRKPGEVNDWCTRGLESKETYYYRGAFADVVRTIDFVCSLEKADQNTILAQGESQGGAFTLIAASLDSRIKAIAPSVPFLSDYKDYFNLVSWPGNIILKAAEEKGIADDHLYTMLSYFDVKNFTDRIKCPVLMAVGLQDDTCPPHTNMAGYNQIRSEKNWICYPHTAHAIWMVPEWTDAKHEFFKEYLRK